MKKNSFLEIFLSYLPYSIIWTNRNAIGDAKTILDLGCGDGTFLRSISYNKKWKVTGVDIFPREVKLARKSKLFEKVIKGDVNKVCKKLIKDKKKFDVVFASQVLEHIDKETGVELLELAEKLAKKRIIIGTPNGYLTQQEEYVEDNPYQEHLSGWTIEEFKKRDYDVFGTGIKFLWKEGTPAREASLFGFLIRLLSLMFAPLVYYYPQLGIGLICVKSKS